MSRGYRSIVVAAGGWLAKPALRWSVLAALAAIVSVTTISWGLSKQAEYEWANEHHTSEYRKYAYHPQLSACLRVSPPDRANCIAQARDAERENARKEADLEAQRVTALWTFVMGCAAVTGMLLSAIGVGLIWTTFRETKRSADAAHDANRAWLDIEVMNTRLYSHWGDLAVGVDVFIKNVGDGPAINVSLFAALDVQNNFWKLPDVEVALIREQTNLYGIPQFKSLLILPSQSQEDTAHAYLGDLQRSTSLLQEDRQVGVNLGVRVAYHAGGKLCFTERYFALTPKNTQMRNRSLNSRHLTGPFDLIEISGDAT